MNRDTAEPGAAALPEPNAEKWVEFHHEHAAPSEYSHKFVQDVTAGADGPFTTDVDGNVLLDFTCHIGATPFGYNNGKMLSKLREFNLVEPMKIAGQDMYFGAGPSPETAEFPGVSHLMDKLTDMSSHYGMDTVFLSDSGAEAVENAMKITRDHEVPAKYGYAFEGSFHGRTFGMLSLAELREVYTRHYPQVADIETMPFYAGSGCSGGDDACDCDFFTDDDSRLRNSPSPEGSHVNPDEIAFVILEPVQDVGGYRFPNGTFVARVGDVYDAYNTPLVVDEIQSGVSRTGEMRTADHYLIEPDIIVSAEGLRVGATTSRIDVFPTEKNRLGPTFGGGDLLVSMQGVLTLDAVEEYGLLNNAAERSRQARELLANDAPDHMVDMRGEDLMLAVEFDTRKRRDAVAETALDRDLLTLGYGKKATRLLPPLDSTERGIELGVGIFCEATDAVATEAVA